MYTGAAAGPLAKVLLPACLALAAAGCGGGGAAVTEPAEETTPPPTQAPPATPTPPTPSAVTVSAEDHSFAPSSVTIPAGGTVTWKMTDDEHDVTWDGPAPPGGNIPKTEEGASVSRTFSTPGTYTYRCARHESKGKTGTVVVTGGASTPPPPATPPSGSATVSTPGTTFSPTEVTIAAGGTVTWNISGATHNVTFQGAAPAGGSIPDTREGNSVSRTFGTAGSYPYECTRHSGMTGRVVVQ